jgi:hypothetical protein
LGSRPGCRTTSALMITRRWRFHLRAAYRVSPKTWAVLPRALESTRARPINRRLRFSSRRLLAMVTRYSTPSASRHSKIRASRQRPRSGVACCYSQLVSVGAANALCSSRALGTSGGARWRGASIAHLKARRTLAGLSCGVLRRLYATGGKGEEAEEVLAFVHRDTRRQGALDARCSHHRSSNRGSGPKLTSAEAAELRA